MTRDEIVAQIQQLADFAGVTLTEKGKDGKDIAEEEIVIFTICVPWPLDRSELPGLKPPVYSSMCLWQRELAGEHLRETINIRWMALMLSLWRRIFKDHLAHNREILAQAVEAGVIT